MRLIDADKGLISKIQRETGCNFITAQKIVDSMPTVEERKVGKWIYDKTIQNWRCSVCNETPKTLGYVGTSAFMTEHFKFCNHCGIEMEGAENG